MNSDNSTLILHTVLIPLFLFTISVGEAMAQKYSITVTAGAFDRSGTVVSFYFPEEIPAGPYEIKSESGKVAMLQVDRGNRGSFLLEQLKEGRSQTFEFSIEKDKAQPSDAGIVSYMDDNTISFESGSSPILSYFHGQNNPPAGLEDIYRRGGYIHPVYSPGGTVLTNHLDTVEHPHHYGIWSAWTSTRFEDRSVDFWNVHNHTGRVDHEDSLELAWQGPVHGGLRSNNTYVDLSAQSPVIALNEEWELTVYDSKSDGGYNIFDLKVTQSANADQPLILNEYHYGGVAFRGHENWNDPENVSFLNSEGYERHNGNETRARWNLMEGIVEGKRAGIAVFDHPSNVRFPQPVRIHPDIAYFVYTPVQLGEMVIKPGSPYTVQYRYITFDGEPDPDELNRLWNDYAYPPGVTVVKN